MLRGAMTEEVRRKLAEIGKQIHKLFPDMYGSVAFQFNLKPDRTTEVNFKVEQTFIEKVGR
jgi:hypothetical protein